MPAGLSGLHLQLETAVGNPDEKTIDRLEAGTGAEQPVRLCEIAFSKADQRGRLKYKER